MNDFTSLLRAYDFFAFFAAFGLAPPLAFALARAFAFFSLPFVVRLAGAFFLTAAFFAFGAFALAGRSGAAGFGRGAGRRASGACFAIMTSTDSDGWAPWRIHFANFSASTLNVDGFVSGS